MERVHQETTVQWHADLPIFTPQGQTDTRALFSFAEKPAFTPETSSALTAQAAGVLAAKQVHTSYLLLATPRSGSFLLCDCLAQTNLAGRPTEYFGPMTFKLMRYWHTSNYGSYIEKVLQIGTTPNGVFGAKIFWDEMSGFASYLRQLPKFKGSLSFFEQLSALFPNLHFLRITRRDQVRQAISYWRAHAAGEWIRFKDRPPLSSYSPIFDFQAIEGLRQSLVCNEKEIDSFLTQHHIQPFSIVYEDLVTSYQETTLAILDYLQIPCQKDLIQTEPRLQKQADALSDVWVERYYQMMSEANHEEL